MEHNAQPVFADRQFLFFLIQNILLGVFDRIDQSFGNHLSIDSICVLSSYTVVTWATYSLYSFGSYAFRAALKHERECLALQEAAGVIIGALLFVFAAPVAGLYGLTPVQNEMLVVCLQIHGASCPVLAFREYMGNYAEYRCLNPTAAVGNVLLYSTMILTDLAVVTFGPGTLAALLFWTPVCSALYSVYMWKKLELWKCPGRFSFRNLRAAAGNGFDLWINRLTGRAATMCGAFFASRLPTLDYSVHSVCYSAAVFGECVTNALHTNIIVKVREKCGTLEEGWTLSKRILKKLCVPSVIIVYGLCYAVLLFLHGKAPFAMSMAWGWVYFTQASALLFYETVGGCLIGSGHSGRVRFGGMVGLIVRPVFIIVAWHMGLRVLVFALMSTVDFFARGLYFYAGLRRGLKKERENAA